MNNLKLGVIVAKIDYEQDSQRIIMPEPRFYTELANLALQYGIDLFIFSSAEWIDGDLYGYRWRHQQWQRELVSLPDIVYDRCFYTSSKQLHACERMLEGMRRKKPFLSFNSSLPNKLVVYEALQQAEKLIPYLPYTESLQKLSSIARWLRLYPNGVILKPASGTHGKGVLHISYNDVLEQYEVRGRNMRNECVNTRFISELNMLRWLYHFKRDVSYLIQPYLSLKDLEGNPFDIRVLMQKDLSGQWQLTGCIARVGEFDGITSNLHGGGKACNPSLLLSKKMGSYKAERLLQKLHMISGQTVAEIEGHFGRFGELALDFGISPQGSIWLLECNSKPGRQAFMKSESEHSRLTVERPLQYAQYIQQRFSTSQKVI